MGRLAQSGYHYAISQDWDVHFLSALHGLVSPYEQLAPYDMSMAQLPPSARSEWGNRVVGKLLASYPLCHLQVIFLAGMAYIQPILDAVPNQVGYWSYEMPLEGLDLFDRIRWFKAHLES